LAVVEPKGAISIEGEAQQKKRRVSRTIGHSRVERAPTSAHGVEKRHRGRRQFVKEKSDGRRGSFGIRPRFPATQTTYWDVTVRWRCHGFFELIPSAAKKRDRIVLVGFHAMRAKKTLGVSIVASERENRQQGKEQVQHKGPPKTTKQNKPPPPPPPPPPHSAASAKKPGPPVGKGVVRRVSSTQHPTNRCSRSDPENPRRRVRRKGTGPQRQTLIPESKSPPCAHPPLAAPLPGPQGIIPLDSHREIPPIQRSTQPALACSADDPQTRRCGRKGPR